jgi:hypothetical protein
MGAPWSMPSAVRVLRLRWWSRLCPLCAARCAVPENVASLASTEPQHKQWSNHTLQGPEHAGTVQEQCLGPIQNVSSDAMSSSHLILQRIHFKTVGFHVRLLIVLRCHGFFTCRTVEGGPNSGCAAPSLYDVLSQIGFDSTVYDAGLDFPPRLTKDGNIDEVDDSMLRSGEQLTEQGKVSP